MTKGIEEMSLGVACYQNIVYILEDKGVRNLTFRVFLK